MRGRSTCRIRIYSDLRYLPWLEQWIGAAVRATPCTLSKRGVWRSTLVLIEAVNNAILHAHHRDASLWIDLELQLAHGDVVMRIEDCGTAYQFPRRHAPALHKMHGRGLFLMKAYCVSARVERKRGKNILHLHYRDDHGDI